MRPFTSGLCSLAVASGLLIGCSGDGDTPSAAPTTTTTTSAEEEFCTEVEALQERFAELGTDAEPDPEMFREVSDAFDDLAEGAPEEIAADMDQLASALRSLADIFEDVDFSDPDSLADLQEQAAALQEQAAEVEEAGANVQEYLSEECGIDFSAGAPGASPGPGGGEPTTTSPEG